MNTIKHTFIRSSASNFGQFLNLQSFLDEIATKKIVFFGETHGDQKIIALQTAVQKAMIPKNESKLHVIMEHFSFEMQHLLSDF